MGAKLSLIGEVFGRLTVISEDGRSNAGKVKWLCKCECGKYKSVIGSNLKNGKTTSCGCIHREQLSNLRKTHHLSATHKKLYDSVLNHFKRIQNQISGYVGWKLDARYSNNTEGVARFCNDLLALHPEECAMYEELRGLELDKDNDKDMIFRPESIVFTTRRGNLRTRRNTVKLKDGTPLLDFVRMLGYETWEDGSITSEYNKFGSYFWAHKGEGHPELLKKANEVIGLYGALLKSLELLSDIRQFKARLQLTKD